jgi:hypothetical protein
VNALLFRRSSHISGDYLQNRELPGRPDHTTLSPGAKKQPGFANQLTNTTHDSGIFWRWHRPCDPIPA